MHFWVKFSMYDSGHNALILLAKMVIKVPFSVGIWQIVSLCTLAALVFTIPLKMTAHRLSTPGVSSQALFNEEMLSLKVATFHSSVSPSLL